MIKKRLNKDTITNNSNDKKTDENVNLYGKVAVFPKNIKPSKAYKFLENVKINPEKLWYMLIQQQEDNLQMIKYNVKANIHLKEFVSTLKSYYLEKVEAYPELYEQVDKIVIEADQNDLFVSIKNIPHIAINNKKLISIISEDLVKILRDDVTEKN